MCVLLWVWVGGIFVCVCGFHDVALQLAGGTSTSPCKEHGCAVAKSLPRCMGGPAAAYFLRSALGNEDCSDPARGRSPQDLN